MNVLVYGCEGGRICKLFLCLKGARGCGEGEVFGNDCRKFPIDVVVGLRLSSLGFCRPVIVARESLQMTAGRCEREFH